MNILQSPNNPVSLLPDDRDYKILEILGRNCRISSAAIARALRVSEDTVRYRIAALERSAMIREYVLFIDSRCLGFTRYHLLIRFASSVKGRKAIYERLKRLPFVMWVNTFIGRYDLQVIVDAADIFHLNDIREQIFAACSQSIKDYSVLACVHDLEFTNLSPLTERNTAFAKSSDSSFSSGLSPRSFPARRDFKKIDVSHTDIQLLDALADNPRATLSELGAASGCDRQTAKSRIIAMIQRGLIMNFGCIANLSSQGFVTYCLLARLEQSTPDAAFHRPFRSLKNIFYAGRMVGDYDIILYMNARTPQELDQGIEQLRDDIGDHILHYDLLVQDRVHHWRQFTPGIRDTLKVRAHVRR